LPLHQSDHSEDAAMVNVVHHPLQHDAGAPLASGISFSGRPSELKGPGGWSATVIETSFAPVHPQAEPIALTEAIEIRKEGNERLEERLRQIDDTQPILLMLELGGHPYTAADISATSGI